jgi:hypothetical protein
MKQAGGAGGESGDYGHGSRMVSSTGAGRQYQMNQ